MGLASNGFEGFISGLQKVLLQNCCVSGQIIGGLTIVYIGNGNQANFFPLSCLIERAQSGFLFLNIGPLCVIPA